MIVRIQSEKSAAYVGNRKLARFWNRATNEHTETSKKMYEPYLFPKLLCLSFLGSGFLDDLSDSVPGSSMLKLIRPSLGLSF